MSKVILIRHGQSLANIDGPFSKYYQIKDSGNILTELGVQQCLETAKELKTIISQSNPVNLSVFCSMYERTRITSNIIMDNCDWNHRIVRDSRINEVDCDWNRSHEDICSGNANLYETLQNVKDRFASIVKSVGFDVILFTHGGVMQQLDSVKNRVKNCEIRCYDRNRFLEMVK